MRYRRKVYKTIKRRLKKYSRYFAHILLKPRNILGIMAIVGMASLILLNMQDASIQFTSMTVGEVLIWQKQFVEQGSPSSAVGRYQFINSTLRGLMNELGIDESVKFDAPLQDRLAVALLERRGIRDYVDNKISREVFAHNLSKEWAALPRAIGDNPEQSYYAGDGLNKAQLSLDEVYASIGTVRKL